MKPDADTLFSFGGTQPFVPLYAVILGDGGHIIMNLVCILALWFVSTPDKDIYPSLVEIYLTP
jgi:hypothetical protein